MARLVPMNMTMTPNINTRKAMTLSLEYHLPRLESFRKLAVGRINARGMAVKQPWRRGGYKGRRREGGGRGHEWKITYI